VNISNGICVEHSSIKSTSSRNNGTTNYVANFLIHSGSETFMRESSFSN